MSDRLTYAELEMALAGRLAYEEALDRGLTEEEALRACKTAMDGILAKSRRVNVAGFTW